MLQLLIHLLVVLLCGAGDPPAKSDPPAPPAVTFDKDVRPILEKRCQPCHFSGGVMYARLPFDQPATITRLGTRLFTRIKDEKEQATIRELLKTSATAAAPDPRDPSPATEPAARASTKTSARRAGAARKRSSR